MHRFFKSLVPLFVYLLVICQSSIVSGQTILSGGDLSGTITKDNSPYRVTGDIRIPKDSTLVIEAGVYLDFDSAKVVRIDGTLKALGTENNPITMTCSDSLLGWFGLLFINTTDQDTSFINYTKIEYIGIAGNLSNSPYFKVDEHPNWRYYNPTAVLAYTAGPIRVNNCKFRRNWRCTEAYQADLEIRNSEYYENLTEFGGYTNGHEGDIGQSHFSAVNNHYHDNWVGGWFVGDNINIEDPGEIRNCVFENGWFPLGIGSSKIQITGCKWNSIRCVAIQLADGSAITMDSCVFDGSYGPCNFGGHIWVNGSSSESTIKNCLFKNSDGFGGSIYIKGNPPTFINCSFTENIQGILHNNSALPLNIVNCVFSKNVKSIMGNKPMFILNSLFVNNTMDTVSSKFALKDTAFLRSSSAIHSYGTNLMVYNSIFWNNKNYLGENLNITVESNLSSVDVHNSIFPEGKNSIYSPTLEKPFTGTFSNCITSAPQLEDTASGNYRIKLPCSDFPSGFNKGYNGPISMQYKGKTYSDILSVLNTDLDGNSRIYDDTTDIGPYEIQALGNRIDIVDSLKDQVVCLGQNGSFWATANTVGLIYEWQTSDDGLDWKFFNNKSEPIVISNAAKSDSGKYFRIKWANSCGIRKTTSPAQLMVPTPKALEITSNKDTINQTTQTMLTGSPGFRSYQWSTGTGANKQTNQINGADLGLGVHVIYLTAIDSNGCQATDSITVTVVDKSSVWDQTTSQIRIYPNPANSTIALDASERASYEIFLSNGQLALWGELASNNQIDISSLAPGNLYILKLTTLNSRYYGRFIKN